MEPDLLERQLALVERQIARGEQHATIRRDVLTYLEAAGLGSSETAEFARDLLRTTENNLRARIAERKRLRAQLQRQSTSPRRAGGAAGPRERNSR
jgi:hypothetical protein